MYSNDDLFGFYILKILYKIKITVAVFKITYNYKSSYEKKNTRKYCPGINTNSGAGIYVYVEVMNFSRIDMNIAINLVGLFITLTGTIFHCLRLQRKC